MNEPRNPTAQPDSAALYTSLVEALPIYVTRKDLQGRVTFANTLFCELLGLPLTEILGKTDFDFFPSEMAQKYRADDARLIETGKMFSDVEENETDGITRYFEVRKTVVRCEDGKPVGTQAVFWDVTARHMAEAALARERENLRTLMGHLPDYIFIKDKEARYIYANAPLLRLLGVGCEDDIIGHTDFDFVRSDLADQYVRDDLEVIRTGEPMINREEKTDAEDGHEMWVLTTKVPVRDAAGRTTGLVGISRDITSRRRAAEMLREAKDAADAANRAKSDFLANMSHEIRTPMNAVIGMTQLLLDTRLTATQREYMQMVSDSGESLLAIINDILDFSKIEAGKLELENAPFSLEECVSAATRSLAMKAHDKNLELAVHIAPDAPDLFVGDSVRFRQVIVNLVGNALKFTEEGEVVVRIAATAITDESCRLNFRVTDTGIGIPEDRVAHIFQAFDQADNSTTRRYGGTGLGLSICSRIVTMLGGSLQVESTVGEGSTFWFEVELPRARGDVRRDVVPDISGLAGLPVLVVDDNHTNQRILEEMLRTHGLEPTLADSAEAALQAMSRAREAGDGFRLVLTDLNMPDIDGLTLARQLLESVDPDCRPTVIVLTSGDRPGDRDESQQIGVAAHLMKPVRQSELFNAIVDSLKLGTSAAGPSATPTRQASLTGLRILLAEDAVANQVLATRLLQKWDHLVTVANNGLEAVELTRSREFDLILMDVQMPELDGIEATEQIRLSEEGRDQHRPIIAMTAHAMTGDRERCLDAGMDGYVSKPIRVAELLAEIERVLANKLPTTEPLTPTTKQDGLVDWSVGMQATQGDESLLAEVVSAFLQEWSEHEGRLSYAIEHKDWKTSRRLGHLVKGVLHTLGATDAAEQAARVEELASDKHPDLASAFETLLSQMEAVCTELRAYLERQSS